MQRRSLSRQEGPIEIFIAPPWSPLPAPSRYQLKGSPPQQLRLHRPWVVSHCCTRCHCCYRASVLGRDCRWYLSGFMCDTNITRPLMLLLGSDGCWSDNLDIGRVDRHCIGNRNIDCIALEWAVHRRH